jgi:hypothetical protein
MAISHIGRDHTRISGIQDIFVQAVEKAQAVRKGVTVQLDQIEGVIRAHVMVPSQDGNFKLLFLVGANNEIAAWGPKGSIRCSLTADSIESSIRDEIERDRAVGGVKL